MRSAPNGVQPAYSARSSVSASYWSLSATSGNVLYACRRGENPALKANNESLTAPKVAAEVRDRISPTSAPQDQVAIEEMRRRWPHVRGTGPSRCTWMMPYSHGNEAT